MAEHAPADVGVPQRLWRVTVEDTVDKIRAWPGRGALTASSPTTAPTTFNATSWDGCGSR
jgi:hypothetical protein